jgi:hypothetical protein
MNDDAKDGLYKQQTAVEWLENKLAENLAKIIIDKDHILIEKLFEQAKEMEKEQIIDAHNAGKNILPPNESGQQYYNETYGSKESDGNFKQFSLYEHKETIATADTPTSFQTEITDKELEQEILNFLYCFEYEEIPHSASYKFDYEACAKALTQRFKEILKNKQ